MTKVELDTNRTLVRTKENIFVNILADLIREYVNSDIAVINSCVIRGNKLYKAGTILTRKDIVANLS
ncbi:5'-nucleotidase C-terminal domain-containing protein [Campylobacter pinnipediorum]|uniref:5'-nucleotidase C-terminal domain-containing protein n=1 Tax=Campylobacter pinnipediorum TaxID=1965231 RepID=UPI00355806C5